MIDVLDVDLLAFEHGSDAQRRAVVDGVMRSLGTGFVFTSHDIPAALIDDAYSMLEQFFAQPVAEKNRWRVPESHGQTGYTGLLVETAASSEIADWKEMLNWGAEVPRHHPLRTRYPHRYLDQVLPETAVPGISAVLFAFHRSLLDLQTRFLRVVAAGLARRRRLFRRHPGRRIASRRARSTTHRCPRRRRTITSGPTPTPISTSSLRCHARRRRGLQLETPEGWRDVVPPAGHVVVNSGMMLERLSNGIIPAGRHRVVADGGSSSDRFSVVQFCHPAPWFALSPLPTCVDDAHPLRFGTIEAGALLDRVLYDIGLIDPD